MIGAAILLGGVGGGVLVYLLAGMIVNVLAR